MRSRVQLLVREGEGTTGKDPLVHESCTIAHSDGDPNQAEDGERRPRRAPYRTREPTALEPLDSLPDPRHDASRDSPSVLASRTSGIRSWRGSDHPIVASRGLP